MLNDQDLSTYGIVQNLAWGGSVPVLAEHLGWDAQAVVSRVREGEGPDETVRVYRISGQLRLEGALECDEKLLEALGAGFDGVVQAALLMLGEVLRRNLEVKVSPAPEDTTPLHGGWVQTQVRVLVGEDSYEIRQYMRPSDVSEVVRLFSDEDEPARIDEELLLDESALPPELRGPLQDALQAPPAPAAAPSPPTPAAEVAAAAAPPVPFEAVQWPPASDGEPPPQPPASLNLLYDVPLTVRAELGRTRRKVEEIIGFGPGSVIDLDRMVGDMVDLYANGQWVGRGEVVVVEENFGVRITEIGSAADRATKLRLREGS